MTAICIIQITLLNLWFEINPKTSLYLHGELVYPLVRVYYLHENWQITISQSDLQNYKSTWRVLQKSIC